MTTQKYHRLEKEIMKTKQHLSALEARLERMRETRNRKMGQGDMSRNKGIEKEFRKKYPRMMVRKELFEIVGTEKRSSPLKDHELLRRIVAERYE